MEPEAIPLPEAIARLLEWRGPVHMPVPHGGIAARTFSEFARNTPVEKRYWFEGEPLFTADQVRAAVLAERADSKRLRELLRRTQTYVCGNRDLMGASELCGEIAEALAATAHLRAAAIRSGTAPAQEET